MRRVKNAVVTTGTTKEFFDRVKDHAAALDRGERLPPEKRISFEDPEDLLRALTKERVRILRTIRKPAEKPTITYLAYTLKRDRRAVTRDVMLLQSLGLLRLCKRTNPGHGVVKVVEPLAEKYHLSATV